MRFGTSVLLLLALTAAAGPHRPQPDFAEAAIRAWHANEDLVRVEVQERGTSHQFAALCDSMHSWWGFFGIYEIRDGQVVWQANVAEEPTEQSILSVRWVSIPGFADPVVEVYGQTHRGNGGLHLYLLRNRELELLLETRAVDFHNDLFTLEDRRLCADYRDVDGDGIGDVTLTGRVQEFDEEDEKTIVRAWDCKRAFVWSSRERRFVEDRSRALGEFP